MDTGKGGRYALLWLRPLKKKSAGVQPKVPQIIAELVRRRRGSDAHTALRRIDRYDPMRDEDSRSNTPLFRKEAKGKFSHITVKHMRSCVRERV